MRTKIGRNDLCPCGSGKKYKKCCIDKIDVSSSLLWQDDESMHVIGEGEKPSSEILDAQEKRIEAIVGEEGEGIYSNISVNKYYNHLLKSLQLPCDVTGIEDFRWEERYVFGNGSSTRYRKLRETQPSYQDIFELLAIKKGIHSKWMLYDGEDLAACVRRRYDGKEFYLGLAEIETVNQKSENHELLDDYSVWFVNSR